MVDPSDTIVAVASPPGGPRRILRLSGPAARSCWAALGLSADLEQPGIHSVTLAPLPDLTLPAQLYVARAPHSYTGQDTVEAHVQAAAVVVEALLERLLAVSGLRRAGPGEFTARALLGGKLDLAQAEGVYEIIHSTNTLQLRAAEALLRGRLGRNLETARDELLACLSLLEADLDFPAHEVDTLDVAGLNARLTVQERALDTLLSQGAAERRTLHLPCIALAGVPNAGKSSLFNALIGRDRCLVAPVAGTTRDVLSAPLSLPHIDALLLDCAGIGPSPDDLLADLAQAAAQAALDRAQCLLLCVDVTRRDRDDDARLLRRLPRDRVLLVGTHADRLAREDTEAGAGLERDLGLPPLLVSATTGRGLGALVAALDQRLQAADGCGAEDTGLLALSARQRQGLREARALLTQTRRALAEELSEVAALLLRNACTQLGETTQPLDEAVLDRVFARFCIGK